MNPYQDIINLQRPVSKKHPRMSIDARAAQFAPYAAQVGHQELIHAREHQADQATDPDREVILEDDENEVCE